MSGLFGTLFHALGRPEADPAGQEELDASCDGLNVQDDIGRVSHHRQVQTAPSTPIVPKVIAPKVTVEDENEPSPVSGSNGSNPSSTSLPPVTPDTSFSSGAQGTASSMSTTADIQICPQPTPFVYRRRALADNPDETLPKAVHFNPDHFRQHPTPASVHIRPEILEVAQPVSEASVEVKAPPFCAWRQEQLDNMKPGKLTKDGKVKVLSSLHGPLSLPYARNPSGVDATVPDHSSYYGNTFGLRAVPRHGDTERVVSGGTDKTQSSHSSSVLLLGKHKQFSDSEHGHFANMVIKDPLQRYNAARTADAKAEGRQAAQPEPIRKARDEYESQVKSTLNPSSSPFSARTMVHRALGVRPPSADIDPFKPLVESALAAANNTLDTAQSDEATINRLIETARYYGLEVRRPSDKSSTGSRIPSNESSALSSSASRMIVTPQLLSTGVSSKADVSANWRAKKVREASMHDMPFGQVAHPDSPPIPVMTIDDLMERYNSPSGKDEKAIRVKLPAPAESTIAPVSKPKAKVAAASAPPKSNSPLSERATNTDSNPVAKPADAKKATPKGTPGAGKLLKKSSSSIANAAKATAVAKAAPKLVPITEQATEASLIQ